MIIYKDTGGQLGFRYLERWTSSHTIATYKEIADNFEGHREILCSLRLSRSNIFTRILRVQYFQYDPQGPLFSVSPLFSLS